MSKHIISAEDAGILLLKLFDERILVRAVLLFPCGTRVTFSGFVDSITEEVGLVLSLTRPPSDGAATISIPFFDRECEFLYGDKRELPEDEREELADKYGDSVLSLDFADGLFVGLIFTP
jgi:hypothetical protein